MESAMKDISRRKQCWLKNSNLRSDNNLANRTTHPSHDFVVSIEALPLKLKKQGFLGRTGKVTDCSSDEEWIVSVRTRKGQLIPVHVYVGNLKIVRMTPPKQIGNHRQQKRQLRQKGRQRRVGVEEKPSRWCKRPCRRGKKCSSAVRNTKFSRKVESTVRRRNPSAVLGPAEHSSLKKGSFLEMSLTSAC